MLNNIALGKYIPFNSPVHRLNPVAKIIAMVIFLVAIFSISKVVEYLIMFGIVVLVIKLSKVSLTYILKSLKPMLFMFSFLFVLNIFILRDGPVLFSILGWPVYTNAITQTAEVVVRLVLMVCITTLLTLTTKPLDLTLGLETLMNPLKKINFPAHEIAMMISIALRFIPTIIEETNRIMNAQASRGVDFQEGKLKDKIVSIVSLLVPLFISAFQRAEELANAMESRGYDPTGKRTRYKQISWHVSDFIAMMFPLLLMIGLMFI